MTQTDARQAQVEAILPLSPLQEGLLFHALHDRGADPYFTQTSFLLEGPLDASVFARAFERVVARHAVLRTSFVWEQVKRPVQVVRREVELPLTTFDWRDADGLFRPTFDFLSRYRTPVTGLYLTGAATFPGAGVWGASGRNAARTVLRTM